MPHKNKSVVLGKALMKSRFKGRNSADPESKHAYEQKKHTDTSNLNLKSVTELNSLDDFLASADLLGTEFTAERLNVQYVQPLSTGIISQQELKNIKNAEMEYVDDIRIPRRPTWSKDISKQELEQAEKDSFISWRRNLAEICEQDHITMTPFEKNLEFWRQLWRVVERSDLVVQIVDARDPLLYRCEDLENYVFDIDSKKKNMILINKADLLSQIQRKKWIQYFNEQKLNYGFFSAIYENERLTKLEKENVNVFEKSEDDALPEDMSQLLTRNQLLVLFSQLLNAESDSNNKILTVGMVGYPNVGKSSTINTIMRCKKVSVSATPGRTKHFQTLFVSDTMQLCDCPGLVFPSFVSSQAEMILSGILPIDEMRNHVPAANLLCHKISRNILEATYGINIIKPREGEDPNRAPNSFEFLNAYGTMRGFMTSHGQPDYPRSARVILKHFVTGKLIYSKAPPGCDQESYNRLTPSVISQAIVSLENKESTEDVTSIISLSENVQNTIPMDVAISKVIRAKNQKDIQEVNYADKAFFRQENVQALTKGNRSQLGVPTTQNNRVKPNADGSKPWKKHNNKKKEKVRRVRGQLY